jgi:hypothetical protein
MAAAMATSVLELPGTAEDPITAIITMAMEQRPRQSGAGIRKCNSPLRLSSRASSRVSS